MYGVEIYQLYPQYGPCWLRDEVTGDPRRWESLEEAAAVAAARNAREELRGFWCRAVEYREDQG